MEIRIVNGSKHKLPAYSTELSAGMDLLANLEEPIILMPMDRKLIATGIFIELPAGYEAQIRPRSGLAIKKGLTVLNAPGTIDADYRGEVKVILINLSDTACEIHDGDRIAQMILSRHERIDWIETTQLSDSNRGEGGFGHTGLK
jgi:dUTP pyrophosphatase